MTKNNSKNWLEIEEEFRKKFNPEIGSHDDDCECSDCVGVLDIDEVVNFFKPYFQEEAHKMAVDELETCPSEYQMDKAIENYQKAKADETLDEKYPVIGKIKKN